MKLLVSHIPEGENKFHYESPKDEWVSQLAKELGNFNCQVLGKLDIDLKLTKLEPDYYLRGNLKFRLAQDCARCAESFEEPITHQFDVALSQAGFEASLNSEESEELDVMVFQGNELDLDIVIREQLILSVPYKALCQENCQGICQKCGQNLNIRVCACNKDSFVSPFSDLQKLKIKQP